MNEDALFKTQLEVRENAEELQNYLKDLENWEKEMKRKEKELKLINASEENFIPPVRNSVAKSKKKRQKKQKDKEKTELKERISGFNYKEWEKFDAETELKKLDEETKSSSSVSNSEEEDALGIQMQKQQAILKKDKGNDFFKKGMYDSAINCYTSGIELDPENPLLHANRAMAFLKKEQYQAAENDCTRCLSIDPTYVKAYLRRASARQKLHKFTLAIEDYLKILELEPGNNAAQLELEKLRKDSEIPCKKNTNDFTSNKTTQKLLNDKLEENNDTPSERLHNILNAMEQPQPFVIPSPTETEQSKLDGSKSHTNKVPEKNKSSTLPACDLKEIENVVKSLEQTLPPVPNTAYQFLADWRKLFKYQDLRYQYLKQFPPEKLPVIFKHDMEAEIFCGILQTLSSSFLDHNDDVFPFMKNLTKVGRFHTLIMFLSSQEKNSVKKLMNHLKSAKPSKEVDELLKFYGS